MIPPLPQLERCLQCKAAPSIGLLFLEGKLQFPKAVQKLRRQWITIRPGVQEQLPKPPRVPICERCLEVFRKQAMERILREWRARQLAESIAALPSITPQTVTEQFGDRGAAMTQHRFRVHQPSAQQGPTAERFFDDEQEALRYKIQLVRDYSRWVEPPILEEWRGGEWVKRSRHTTKDRA